MAKIALSLERDQLHGRAARLRLRRGHDERLPGRVGRPADRARPLAPHRRQATLAYGYGMSVTPLQLAQAYATIGALGLRRPCHLPQGRRARCPRQRVLDEKVARDVLACSRRS
jgi:cell division protein FtsI (penicillin-binding protein 3)